MLFDDRLATVLRSQAGGESAVRTQFRQLLDLLGSSNDVEPSELTSSAYARLVELAEEIPGDEQSRIMRTPGLRLRNPRLVAFLAEGDAQPAAAALATARLSENEWLRLIPELPMVARGFLRHRRDLPESSKHVLRQLGVYDLVLPEPAGHIRTPETTIAPALEPEPEPIRAPIVPPTASDSKLVDNGDPDGIRALLRRIEAFRERRQASPPAPRLPLGDTAEATDAAALRSFDFASDPDGRITWASTYLAPQLVGMRLARPAPGIIAALTGQGARAMRLLQPLRSQPLVIDSETEIAGAWRIDAAPVFSSAAGRFCGYRGRIRRPLYVVPDTLQPDEGLSHDSAGDRMRQILHELRTPVNAIQGFAEIIQQQLFGHAPNEYRALAAAIGVDSAKLLASFDEIDRLARLETGALDREEGEADLREAVSNTIERLDGVLRRRNSGIILDVHGPSFTTALSHDDLLALVWRILASLAGSLAPAEKIAARLESAADVLTLELQLPAAIVEEDDPLATQVPQNRPILSAGMFGKGFSLRLAKAEIIAASGTFELMPEVLTITLPLLTDNSGNPSNGDQSVNEDQSIDEDRDGNAA